MRSSSVLRYLSKYAVFTQTPGNAVFVGSESQGHDLVQWELGGY